MNPLTVLPYIARLATFLVALISIAAGVRSIVKPVDFATSFGFPPSHPRFWRRTSLENQTFVGEKPNPEEEQAEPEQPSATLLAAPLLDETNPFIPVVGVRNIALGLSILVFALLDEAHATGILLLCNLVSMAGDTVLCRRQGTRGSESSHLVATLLFAGLGGYNVLQ